MDTLHILASLDKRAASTKHNQSRSLEGNESLTFDNPLSELKTAKNLLEKFKGSLNLSSDDIKNLDTISNQIEKSSSDLLKHEKFLEVLTQQFENLHQTGFVDWQALDSIRDGIPPKQRRNNLHSKSKLKNPATRESRNVRFPEYKYPEKNTPTFNVNVGTILDKFSQDAFSYEWNSIPLGVESWPEQLTECDLVFVESAWAGNEGEWKYALTGPSAPRKAIIQLVQKASELNIPTVFWNKEDPPHFADFLETARLFDIVLTTDESCVAKYKAELPHAKVGVLPFAAQTKIHNPARPHNIKREKDVSFGGMYFRHKYPERREQMDYLLPAAEKFGLDIFSRQLGNDINYQFPDQFKNNIVGSLPYGEMLTAYHAYKVFLNVNSVVTSSTMCARRVFEILASGGAVVSPPSPAIRQYFGESLVPMVDTEQEAFDAIRTLLNPGGTREKLVHAAQRIIWENHTFSHRVENILQYGNIPAELERYPSVSLIVPTIRPENMRDIFRNAGRQSYKNIELVIMQHGFELESNELHQLANEFQVSNWVALSRARSESLGSNLNALVKAASGSILSKMDDDDFYGDDYVRDLVNAHKFSGASVVGKAAAYVYFESTDSTILSYESWEHRYTDFVRGATITANRQVFEEIPFENLRTSEDSTFLKAVSRAGGSIYAADRFNFCIRRASDPGQHTWQVADKKLFSTGPVAGYGSPEALMRA